MNAIVFPIPLWTLERVPASKNKTCFLKISFELFTLQSYNKIFNEKESNEWLKILQTINSQPFKILYSK